ncbi:alpha-ketoacid dehydrogenase subunit alpha/beta [Nocardioides ganghwensis]|jgi:2-oxoisovalerate dehydrogenase E1 component|uniref:dihydrolipoyllysine-residue succinyltransferase n=1 Tax=Nocardioides ganghwensis TaxID=252230 RepID=A0A4Q2SHD7_9ACTN|nr:alpha-ketoacid dehydrogenase subunit alpha/beta [Nocardioides ganghwensis]MBD3946528.1 MFS transporter [Nocardioides ganghwensis]RYC03268.1 MFS transporter [Nocardioides ganghwensis]
MTKRHELTPAAPWVELTVDQDDWDAADPQVLLQLLGRAQWIRSFEEYVLELANQGLVHGPAHSSVGQEGGAVGSVLPLRSDDFVNGSHRGHHQFLAKAFGHVLEAKSTGLPEITTEVREVLHRTLAEICGLADGYCRGRGGSMHLQWREAGAMGTNAIVGGGVPQAAGFAWNMLHSGSDAVSVTYFGDGAVNIGSVLETFNLAAAWKLPVMFFIENNQYAVSTPVAKATGEPRLSGRGAGFGIPSWRVDGMDALAVHTAMTEAVDHMRAGKGPTILEADLYRFFHQNGAFPGSAFGYRDKEEEASWRARDPIAQLRRQVVGRGLATEADIDAMTDAIDTTMQEIGDQLLEPVPGGKPRERRIIGSLWPDTDFVDVGVRGDLSELEGSRFEDEDTFAGELAQRRFIDVVSDVMARRMETDDRIVVMGEDVDGLKGGTNGATKKPLELFPDRVLGTPISENAFAGLGGGMALDGRFRPVVEFMYADFMWVAADQLFNQVAKARHMFGGDSSVPFVLRSKLAAGTGYGSQHSMDPAGILTTAPGLRVVAPSTPFDYVGLMNTALTCDDPVVVLEHVDLYTSTGPGPVDDLDYLLPVGKAAVRRTGEDLTVISYLTMVNHCLEALDQVDVSADLIDLRWLDRASLDWETIEASVRKTNQVLIVEQGAVGTSYGGWLADEIQRRLFDWLDAPVERVTGAEASPSISKVLERAAIARTDEVVDALRRIAQA